jgi:hypothetical protein
MPKLRRPHVASPDEIKITRDGDTAIVEYADPKVATTYFTMGAGELAKMSDAEFLNYWNAHIEATDELIRSQKYVATEIPVGRPQTEYSKQCDQWVPRGDVVRGVILAGSEPDLDETFISIDERDFSLREFVKMVGTFEGWGVRITFVPDHEIHLEPKIKVRDPDEHKKGPNRGRKKPRRRGG